MPTMIDVAKRANVALSTVSYAINGTRPISDETKQRIFAAMEELGYRPNALARGLASKRSRILALLFSAPERGLGITELEFVTGAMQAANENSYHLILWSTELNNPGELRRMVQAGLADGVIAMEVRLKDERIDVLREIAFPFSMIGRCENTDNIPYVDIDFEQTVQEAVRCLAELGHTRIAFINHSPSEFDTGYGPSVRTHKSFEQAIAERGLTGITRFCRDVPTAGYGTVGALLDECPGLTAFIVMNERAIPGIMQAVADKGKRVPDDCSLVSIVTSAHAAEMMMPPLTAMEAPGAEMGRRGAEFLIAELEGEEQSAAQQILVPCRLVVRGSTAPAAQQAQAATAKRLTQKST